MVVFVVVGGIEGALVLFKTVCAYMVKVVFLLLLGFKLS